MNNTDRLHLIIRAIRERREALNYSQEYMAYKMQMGQNCYSKIELGNSKLTVDRLLSICLLLNLDTRDILEPQVKLEDIT
ncbi:helix-turn-helix protein [Mucilaginibacter yixingensis]|uniref:Helix-turn-helix protein n=1 Tax=Mucilaginibacter yixingensis TaxID=1295612 RepID=A0A2T5J993_9SPHI|nr:helix-turn-helix transcriptional regulator [Mucilaginibacter yixingensis]PTQ96579.1 helix-turn-helix protein [Mucilaginibacter yixingensis]